MFSVHCRVGRKQEISADPDFQNIAEGSQVKSFLGDVGGRFLSHEDDFRIRGKFAHKAGGVESIEEREADVKKNQVRLQVGGFLNGVKAVGDFSDDLKAGVGCEDGSNQLAKRFKVFDYENTDCGTFHVGSGPSYLIIYTTSCERCKHNCGFCGLRSCRAE